MTKLDVFVLLLTNFLVVLLLTMVWVSEPQPKWRRLHGALDTAVFGLLVVLVVSQLVAIFGVPSFLVQLVRPL